MKKLVLVLAVAVAVAGLSSVAHAAKTWDDMSWWGNTGATPEPQPESGTCPAQMNRDGYWWWPTEAASNADDGELWGNRGIVYRDWEKPVEKVVEPVKPQEKKPEEVRTVPVLNNVLFDFDKSDLKPAGKQELDKLAGDLRGASYDAIQVTGHTDRLGGHAYNQRLSERRAQAVSAYLVQSAAIPPGKIAAKGVDGADPVTKPGDCKGNKATPQLITCLQPDRRVDIEVTGTK